MSYVDHILICDLLFNKQLMIVLIKASPATIKLRLYIK